MFCWGSWYDFLLHTPGFLQFQIKTLYISVRLLSVRQRRIMGPLNATIKTEWQSAALSLTPSVPVQFKTRDKTVKYLPFTYCLGSHYGSVSLGRREAKAHHCFNCVHLWELACLDNINIWVGKRLSSQTDFGCSPKRPEKCSFCLFAVATLSLCGKHRALLWRSTEGSAATSAERERWCKHIAPGSRQRRRKE